ncbi:GNAT family N-acetyltransferase [Saxibacter everestensis]|uniref:GNAT family N-acetyltransferase n=1 Tax=Saxibacter everestensis TaxID=2909229 RepID=A0ABY8QPN1_9MICO|nr:GNAT family N-acetyltransferase [Brevibacteriaceae bacterium ZFBP1038]
MTFTEQNVSSSDTALTIVPLDEIDATDLRDWLINAQTDFWDERDLRDQHHPVWFRQFGSDGLVARSDGTTVGYLLGVVPVSGVAYVHLVAARRDHRGMGIGRKLYESFIAKAKQQGARSIEAMTSAGNSSSIAFHTAIGFRAEIVADYAGPGEDRVLFEMPLNGNDHG